MILGKRSKGSVVGCGEVRGNYPLSFERFECFSWFRTEAGCGPLLGFGGRLLGKGVLCILACSPGLSLGKGIVGICSSVHVLLLVEVAAGLLVEGE